MERTYETAATLVGRAAGPLAGHLGAFVGSLIDQQFTASVIYVKAQHALAFDGWLAKRGAVLTDLGDVHIERYQNRRRRRHQRILAETRRRECNHITQLLQFLRDRGACPTARTEITAADDLTARYEQHLQAQQGLTAITIKRYRTIARRFLHERFACGVFDLRTLRAGDMSAFMQPNASSRRHSSASRQPCARSCATRSIAAKWPPRSLLRCRPWPPGPPRRQCPRRYRLSMRSVRSTAVISIRRSVCAIAPCCCFSRVWGFALTRSSRCNSKTAPGTAVTCDCAARIDVSNSCRCQLMWARPSLPICSGGGP